MVSQKEFIIGCLIGGVFGASAALLIPNFTSGLNGLARTQNRKYARRHHETHSRNHEHVAAKHHAVAPKKARTKKAIKPHHKEA